jgi:hypothetical protein
MNRAHLLRRIRLWLFVFIAGLVFSGLTAFPLETELSILNKSLGATVLVNSGLAVWLKAVQHGLSATNEQYPFLAYGTDWLAFAHLAIATAFIGPWIDPVRNKWVLTFGLIACTGVVPLALIAGGIRHIPLAWRMLDCSFGILGAVPLWICRRTAMQLEREQNQLPPTAEASVKSRRIAT